MQSSRRAGFTLLELSIVLIVIGLIVGGIMAGQTLVRSSRLRSVVSSVNQYRAAIETFRTKYGELPGDLRNATAYWGAQDSDEFTCEVTASVDARTCNGNGNGLIIQNLNYVPTDSEKFRMWQHLSNAGMIFGQYSGIGVGARALPNRAITARSGQCRIQAFPKASARTRIPAPPLSRPNTVTR